MSYLDLPRLTFSGSFQADVATVNNDVRHFDPDRFELVHQEFQTPGAVNNGWFNPVGGNAFRLLGCTVARAAGPDGAAAAADPVLGARVGGSAERVSAKIVDLDPQWQMASQLWGLRVELVAGDVVLVAGDFEPAAFRDLWGRGGLAQATSRYQSVLRDVVWAAEGVSPLLDALRARTDDGLLSIRLTTTGWDGRRTSPRFTLGRTTGVIGPYRRGEPRRFVAGRRFVRAAPGGPAETPLNFFDGVTDETGARLTVDLANALPLPSPPPAVEPPPLRDLGELHLAVALRGGVTEGAAVVAGTDVALLGPPVPYRDGDFLTGAAGIVAVGVPAPLRPRVLGSPLMVVAGTDAAGHRVLIRESGNGWLVRADTEADRASPGDTVELDVRVTRFGRPQAGQRVRATARPPFTPAPIIPAGPGVPAGGEPEIGSPADRFVIEEAEPTGADGRTTCLLRCADPGTPRGFVDGQIYQARLDVLDENGAVRPLPRPAGEWVTVLVFSGYTAPERPTWDRDVRELLTSYANLYPVMSRRLLDLADHRAVYRHREILRFALARDIADPNHMPVTRDLSPARRAMLLRWLADPDPPPAEAPPGPGAAPPLPPPDDQEPLDPKEIFLRRFTVPEAEPGQP